MTGLSDVREFGIPESEWYATKSLELMIGKAIERAATGSGARLPIPAGSRVLIKPNWVHHINMSDGGLDCLYTSREFVLVCLKAVLDCRPGAVALGDAPLQSCLWDRIVTPDFLRRVGDLDREGVVSIVDFRRTIMRGHGLRNGQDLEIRPTDRYSLFDLGEDSLLEPISSPPGRFRVTMYDPALLARRHFPGVHQYLIAREALEADVILNLPKLKTHRMAGITGALKNLVGINENKEFLPHHRRGGSSSGGDCYPGRSGLKALAESLLDRANDRIGRPTYSIWSGAAKTAMKLRRFLSDECELDGGWSGNDTVWRTVLDINRIALYGTTEGTMCDTPQRTILHLTDALVCGHGNGPLSPEPFPLGCVTFSDSSPEVDRLHCGLIGFDTGQIPMVREAESAFRWPLGRSRNAGDGDAAGMPGAVVAPAGRARPATGWQCLSDSSIRSS